MRGRLIWKATGGCPGGGPSGGGGKAGSGMVAGGGGYAGRTGKGAMGSPPTVVGSTGGSRGAGANRGTVVGRRDLKAAVDAEGAGGGT